MKTLHLIMVFALICFSANYGYTQINEPGIYMVSSKLVDVQEKITLSENKMPNTATLDNLHVLDCVDDVPEANKLVKFVNLIIDKYNTDRLNDVCDFLQEEWKKAENDISPKYKPPHVPKVICEYTHNSENDTNCVKTIFFIQ